ncbi:MAG: energy-coupling factor transporter transmembrane protein EcfT [Clostridia bacterium]|nr:energy-coupling factor transporter transmembrane protein EcfT [Clostridia bacterium]MBQ3849288.1 energy-coupling factor transporter transmembrane protein EcfT [Clostridia bacterium]MBR5713369.1 energy-coupling factor transporter transmembrane protein EcfT [Clostridia bacterium]MBR5718886.1 energy-coupling factor transporter transmembrane protein EcfT [Clostridia bacterium]
MFKDITLGQYFPVDSPVHRLDPRTKLILLVMYIVAVFITDYIWIFGFVLLFMLFMTYMSRVPISYVTKAIKPMKFILPFMFLLNLFMIKTGTVLFSWRFITVTTGGVYQALFIILRLIALVTGASLLTLTTTPVSLTEGLERLLSPLKIIKFPVHELAMMMTIALRFIPTLLEEADKIMKAQLARGADLESGNVLKRAKAMLPILIPLFVNSFRRAEELALAMESRCYHGGEGRTRLRILKFHWNDLIAFLIMAGLIAAVVILQNTFKIDSYLAAWVKALIGAAQ